MKKVSSVDEYIAEHQNFQEALSKLREIIISTDLEETIKWNSPVYTLNGKNVIGLGAFKNHFGIWFFNGVFLKDTHNLLTNAQEGKTKGLRQMRFENIKEIDKNLVLSYVNEAIKNQKLGKEIKPAKNQKEINIPMGLQSLLNSNSNLKSSFKSLTAYKQREYYEYIISAKREATKQSRMEKIIPMILDGIGLNDKYRNC